MLSPEYIDHLPDRVVELYADLEIRILEDMARRISKTGALTETAQWQMWRLEQIGAEREFICYHLQRLTGKTQGEINELLVEAGEEALYYDDQIYRAAGLNPKALRDSEALQKIIKAGSDKTMRLFENLTSTTADTASRQFENALDAAYMDITSGAFSYQDAVRSAVKSLSKAGIDAIIYPSGHTDKMDVAVRRAVLTGVNQTAARMQIARADEMGCDLVETTAHMGARPEHMDWQGRIFSRSGKSRKYPDFIRSTGYGTGPGLCGWNCRHSFFPYFEGLSERAYSRAKLREYENKTVTYNGRTLPYYDATQQQRYLERQIRRWKREYLAMDAAGLDTSEASAKLAAWRAKQKDFLTQTGLGEDKFRSQVYGFGRSQAAKARNSAERKYQTWIQQISAKNSAPKTLAKYYEEKYNNSPAYQLLRGYSRAVEKGDISPLVGLEQYQMTAKEIEKELIGVVLTNGEKVSSYATHFIDRVIGQTADPHKSGMRTGVPVSIVKECLLNTKNISPPYQIEMPDGSIDIRINIIGEKCSVAFSTKEHKIIQTNPKKGI